MSAPARRVFWSRTLRLTLALLTVWLLVNLALPWFAPGLNRWQGFGFPVGYWLVAQGALLVYLAIIAVYVWAMDRLEAQYLAATAADADGVQTEGTG